MEFIYSGKANLSRIYEVTQDFHRPAQKESSLQAYFTQFKWTYEGLNSLHPISSDVKQMHMQQEQLPVVSFLSGLHPKFSATWDQTLTSSENVTLADI